MHVIFLTQYIFRYLNVALIDKIYFWIKLSNNIEKAYFEELRVHISLSRHLISLNSDYTIV